MARYQPVDFMGRKDDEPFMIENLLERTERMLVQMHCMTEEKLECAISLLQDEVTRPNPDLILDSLTGGHAGHPNGLLLNSTHRAKQSRGANPFFF